MSKINSISGFPEWLPEEKIAEDQVVDLIRGVYLSHGYTPIETPAIEYLTTLASKGEITKEIYSVRRVREESDTESEYGLHFDLTVPLARYVAQHFGKLTFPFKRYQMQKVWRGERPQEGRFREFYQFDIDIICRDELPLACDAEVIDVVCKVFSKLKFGPFTVKLNNRKLLLGFYNSLGLNDKQKEFAIISVDKIDKIGPDGVIKELEKIDGISADIAERIVGIASLKATFSDAEEKLTKLGINDPLFSEGKSDVLELFRVLSESSKEHVELDLSIARGLDYYTGTIVETYLDNHKDFGSVCSGGRYDDLASRFIKQKLPGVGVSIGLTRLLSLAFKAGLVKPSCQSPTKVLVTVYNEEQRPRCNSIADEIRQVGVSTEVHFKASKIGKQIEYADKKGIGHVIFIQEDGTVEAKNLKSKDQQVVKDLVGWAKTLQ